MIITVVGESSKIKGLIGYLKDVGFEENKRVFGLDTTDRVCISEDKCFRTSFGNWELASGEEVLDVEEDAEIIGEFIDGILNPPNEDLREAALEYLANYCQDDGEEYFSGWGMDSIATGFANYFYDYVKVPLEKIHNKIQDEPVKIELKGFKEKDNKLSYELDWEFLEALAQRMSSNKGKYKPYNWKKPVEVEDLKQSLFRHVIEVMKGEYKDDGRAFGHLEAIALNAMFINYQLKHNSDG